MATACAENVDKNTEKERKIKQMYSFAFGKSTEQIDSRVFVIREAKSHLCKIKIFTPYFQAIQLWKQITYAHCRSELCQ